MPEKSQLAGLWRRSLIVWPDGRRDTTTTAVWLQGSGLYADLRQPAERPGFEDVACLRELRPGHLAWLAGQEGFAGRLHCTDACFEWQRYIDYQPPASLPDAGYLVFEGAVLVEHGRDAPYVEHWHQDEPTEPPLAAARLLDSKTGRCGILVRAGSSFMYARERAAELHAGGALADCVLAAPTLREAQDAVDCEVSFGTVEGADWLIRRSSLPFREGDRLDPHVVRGASSTLATLDLSAEGATLVRRWEIVEIEGTLDDFLGTSPAIFQTKP